jgi:phosphohistidine phosphatase
MTKDERRQLVLVRHAKSSWDDPTLTDHERPLARRGRKALPRMRGHLEELKIRPDVVLCSSARRTQETFDGIRNALAGKPEVKFEDGLYGASADEMLSRLKQLSDDVRCAMVVGHNPGMEDLGDLLTSGGDVDAVPTGAIALLSFTGSWRDLEASAASLDDIWRPRPPP